MPTLLLMVCRPFTPLRTSAAIKFSGMPQMPKPPTMTVEPSVMSATASSALAATLFTIHPPRYNRPTAFTESDAYRAFALAISAQNNAIAVFQKFPFLAGGQADQLGAPARQLQQASPRVVDWPGNRPAPEKIARTQIATVTGMVRQKLGHRPVLVAKISAAQTQRVDAGFTHFF